MLDDDQTSEAVIKRLIFASSLKLTPCEDFISTLPLSIICLIYVL